ncbi:Rho termination factor N-terminal domain-containing protein [Synechocystis sp. LKSZ1]|uniref:Rho termination factor N-terminal domain-containing protein n=1 Tax=Synechocystis sp. LKSZ1 TaxID=3144951 RepID=UPI00336BE046
MQQDIGTLLHIYLDEIKPGQPTQAHRFLITSSAKAINEAGGRNWMPVIVKQTGAESFQAIANTFILAAAEEAGINKVWCIIADDTEATQNCAQLLAQEKIPRINLTTASREEIKLGLDYLIRRPVNPLVGVTLATALEKIDVPQRQSWKASLNEITGLKCAITKGKKLDIFKEVFYAEPPKVLKPSINLTTASREEIQSGLEYLVHHSDNPLPTLNIATALDKLDVPERQYWQESLTEVVSLKCGITKGKKLDSFKEVFYTTPLVKPEPSLDELPITQLRKLAQEKGIPGTSRMKKADLLKVLGDI